MVAQLPPQAVTAKNVSILEYLNVFIATLGLFLVLWLFFPSKPAMSFDNIPNSLLPLSLIRESNFDLYEFKEAQDQLNQPDVFSYFELYALNKGTDVIPKDSAVYYYFLTITPSNNVISSYPIGTPLLATPIFVLFSLIKPELLTTSTFFNPLLAQASYFAAITLTVLTTVMMYVVLNNLLRNKWLAVTGASLFVFGTEVISSTSRALWQHTGSLFMISVALYMYQQKNLGGLLFFSLLATLCRYPSAVILLPLIARLAWEKVKAIKAFESLTQIAKKIITLESVLYMILSLVVVLGIMYYHYYYMDSISFFAPHYTANRFSGSPFSAVLGLLFSPSRGLFMYTPFFIFSLFYLFRYWKKSWEYGVGVILYILVTTSWDMWWGGTSHGYRMLSEVIPPLIVLFCFFIQQFQTHLKNTVLLSLVLIPIIWSVFVQSVWGAHYYSCGFNEAPVNINVLNDQQLHQKLWSGESEFTYCWKKMNKPYEKLAP
jgi:hypothetical protein